MPSAKYLIVQCILAALSYVAYHMFGHNAYTAWKNCRFLASAAMVAPAIFVNHGGGPLPLLNDKNHRALTKFLKDEVKQHINFNDGSIKAIVLVTAHWEADIVTISGAEHHDLYFDYYGFPEVSYTYKYDAPGSPALAKRLRDKFKEHGIEARIDTQRGWDHGVFVPMMLIRPEADIPIVQISVLKNQDPDKHWQLGRALYDLREDGVAIIGSGMSYHNMINFMSRQHTTATSTVNDHFDYFLHDSCLSGEDERRKALVNWRNQKGAFDAHPQGAAEHFMPLLVIAGAGGRDQGERIMSIDYADRFKLSSFIWKA